MYNKLIKKFYILKLFSISTPTNSNIRKNNYFLCKYIALNTPYANVLVFLKELNKILFINKKSYALKKLLFFCSNKIFLKCLNKEKLNIIYRKINNQNITNKKFSFFILFTNNYTSRQIAYIKDKKIPSIGLTNFNSLPQITDYTLLLNNKYFASIFFLNFIIKKLINNVFN